MPRPRGVGAPGDPVAGDCTSYRAARHDGVWSFLVRPGRRTPSGAMLAVLVARARAVGGSHRPRRRSARRPRARPPRRRPCRRRGTRGSSRSPTRSPSCAAWRSTTRSPPSSSTTPRSRSRWRSTRASSPSRTRPTSRGRRASSAPSGSSAPTSTSSTPSSSLPAVGRGRVLRPEDEADHVKGTNLDDVATRVTVAHELTHALQDQHFDLRKLEQGGRRRRTGRRALRTVVEGDAVRIQTRYEQTLSDADQQAYRRARRTRTSRQSQDEIAAKGVPRLVERSCSRRPYALGPSMLDVARSSKEQVAGSTGCSRNPPTADAAFVTPSTLVDHRTFQTVETPALAAGGEALGQSPTCSARWRSSRRSSSRLDNATALSCCRRVGR